MSSSDTSLIENTSRKSNNEKKFRIFSVSCVATVLTGLYVVLAIANLYRLMYPISYVKDLHVYTEDKLVGPLWKSKGGSAMGMKVYLSSSDKFTLDFVKDEFLPPPDVEVSTGEAEDVVKKQRSEQAKRAVLLWEEHEIMETSLAKSFILTSNSCESSDAEQTCSNGTDDDSSFRFASSWLDDADKTAIEKGGGLISAMSASAGSGIESTSILLSIYQSLSDATGNILAKLRGASVDDEDETSPDTLSGVKSERTILRLSPSSPIWSALQKNSTLYLHVVLARQGSKNKPQTLQEATRSLQQAYQSHSVLLGRVGLVKYDAPHHIDPPRRILYHDLSYILKKYISRTAGNAVHPPWEMSYTKPEEYETYQMALRMKQDGQGYPYWKPEVSIKFVNDDVKYPIEYVGMSGMDIVPVPRRQHPSGLAYLPALHVDEIGLTSEKYIPVNETVQSVPLRITFDRNVDITLEKMGDKAKTRSTRTFASRATTGGISPARWRLLTHLSKSLDSQKELGFEQSDIDDLRRLIADTNVTLLAITVLASVLHLLFEFLTFKNDISFWNRNTDLTGLSVRTLFMDMISQVIILLYLIEKDSSLLMTVPSGIGCAIALWKCQRGAGFRFVRIQKEEEQTEKRKVAWWNLVPSMMGYELRATRLEIDTKDVKKTDKGGDEDNVTKTADLTSLTIEMDRLATRALGSLLLPVVIAYTCYSLIWEEHTGWYSWLITSASSAVYALGFVLMTPQLFLNYKLKSVAHLPWRVLGYRFLNTFIDDLFAFIIRMPTMARISCFRDDIVFIIYLRVTSKYTDGEQNDSKKKK